MVSVLLPVYKPNFEYLHTAIESILNQSYENFELFVLYEPAGDEKSAATVGNIREGGQEKTELTLEYVKNIEALDSRIRLVQLPAKAGLPKALNRGLDLANGKYIARMDADDISLPERFERQVRYMEMHPDIDILGGTIEMFSSSTENRCERDELFGVSRGPAGKSSGEQLEVTVDRRAFNTRIPPKVRSVRLMFENAGIAHPTAMYRRSSFVCNRLCYDETLKGAEDYRLWADAAEKGMLIDSLPEPVLRYRKSEGQATNRLSNEMVEWDDATREKLWQRYSDYTDHELHVIKAFRKAQKLKYARKDYEGVFKKALSGNVQRKVVPQRLLEKELTWQWLRYAMYQLRRQGDGSLIWSKMTAKVLKPWNLAYVAGQAWEVVRVGKDTWANTR